MTESTGTLDAVEVFAAGEWNNQQFTVADLDELVRGFEVEKQAGRLPVKLGHSASDTEPAHGWIDHLWRDGDRLLARLTQVPADTMQAIRDGRWRHVSCELLRDVKTAAGRSYRVLLDGLALLGSARPAVDVLKPLHASFSDELEFGGRLAFTSALHVASDSLRAENDRLRARLHRQQVEATIEGDVRAGLVVPAARERFAKLFKLTSDESYSRVTTADWMTFRASQPRPPARGAATHTDSGEHRGESPDSTLVAMTRQYLRDNEVRHFQLTGERLTFDRAAQEVAREVARTNPGLLRSFVTMMGEAD
jgi:hypothetical protein